jgi:RNA polymerase subunit RPABC4/transcription elongation factor Spt4
MKFKFVKLKKLRGVAMPRCQYCGGKIDEGAVFCPKCGESLVSEDTGWADFQIQEKLDEAKHRANMYTISAIVLVTVGMMGGSILFVSSSLLGLFGIVFVCLGIGCTASADRYEYKARNLKKRLKPVKLS